ncbi:MAG TPA: SAM-dependent methyltransferase [Casimicrobiaceae bacterium]|nr:SAM-dependent methyltransferase [Casimicrobiaceae bacterium]
MSTPARGPGRLYVIPSLLGVVPPAAVLPRRTIETARGLAHFVVETPRAARQFLKTLDMPRPLSSIAMAELSEHTPAQHARELLEPALQGHDLGLLTDAGCPGVADPGAPLVRAAHEADVQVVPLVGPSAVLLALMASGMNGQAFVFHGYLPVKPQAREAALHSLDRAAAGATQIFIETPYRNDAMIAAVLAACRAESYFGLAVDLTLPAEQVLCRTVAEWRSAPRIEPGKRPAIFLLNRS